MDPLLIPWIISKQKRKSSNNCDSELLEVTIPRKRLSFKPQINLIYLHACGQLEIAKSILIYANIRFDETKFENEAEWNSLEKESPLLTLPMLEWNTKKINDGDAILRMIAKICGLSGQGIFEQAQADAIFSAMNALVFSLVEYVKIKLSSKHQTNFETFNGMYFTVFEPAVKKYFGILEEYASKQTSNGFFLSSGISFVDFAMFNLFDFLEKLHPNLLRQFSKCQAIVYRVSNLPKFQKYLKAKQKSLH